MKSLTVIFILTSEFCFSQKTIDKRFLIEIDQTDSIQIAIPYKDKTKRDSITKKYSNWHERARSLEKYLLKIENPGIVRGTDDLIEIKLLDGRKIKLIPDNSLDETDFTFESYFRKLELILFRVQWSEGNNYLLVNKRTGKRTYVIGRLFFSPDNKFAMAINCDLIAQYSSNGFQLFEVVNRELKEIWEYDPKFWAPVELKWLDNLTLISRNEKLDTINRKIKTDFIRIKIKQKPVSK